MMRFEFKKYTIIENLERVRIKGRNNRRDDNSKAHIDDVLN